eukprot:TRINITY_DN4148_c0_g1_i1.p1 TRINITY_DN4148_c0_g1~~TRINITY_DN4148_c0_g1_i1.p1  ORF type:complete len:357 (+),score=62.11 TRINITY_DN4148_c0_g1_i1:56-1126(+)
MPMAELGTMGTIINPSQDPWERLPLSMLLLFAGIAGPGATILRSTVPYLKKHYPLRAKHTIGDCFQIVAIQAILITMYGGNLSYDLPRHPDSWLNQNRVAVMAALLTSFTAVYYLCWAYAFPKLTEEQRPAQAANVIRIGVKFTLFCGWALSGEFITMMNTHPLELTPDIWEPTNYVTLGINALYMWELLFRDLRPVNVIHHGIACMGFTSYMEWSNLLEPGRSVVTMPIMGSLIEVFCCMGTVAYRFLPKGKLLHRLMLGIMAFVLVSYNLLLVGYLSVLIGYNDLFSFSWGKICMPSLALFTYPAQMNMARVFWVLAKKSKPEPKDAPAEIDPEAISERSGEVIRRRPISLRKE